MRSRLTRSHIGGGRVVGLENRLPIVRIVGADRVDEPGRVRESRLVGLQRGLRELLALALKTPQHRVHEPARAA